MKVRGKLKFLLKEHEVQVNTKRIIEISNKLGDLFGHAAVQGKREVPKEEGLKEISWIVNIEDQ